MLKSVKVKATITSYELVEGILLCPVELNDVKLHDYIMDKKLSELAELDLKEGKRVVEIKEIEQLFRPLVEETSVIDDWTKIISHHGIDSSSSILEIYQQLRVLTKSESIEELIKTAEAIKESFDKCD